MAVAGYFDQLSGFSADMLLGALIDAGVDREEIEAALKRHHGVDCVINVTRERVDGTRVTYASLSCVEASVPETYRTIPGGGADAPAGALIGRVTGHLEQNVNELWGAQDPSPDHAQDHTSGHTSGNAPPVEALGGRHAALCILVLCNALHLHGIESLHHVALPFAAGIDATPPLLAALMRGATVRPVDRAPVDLAGCAVLTALSAGSMHSSGFTLRSVGCGGNDADRGDGIMVRLGIGVVAPMGEGAQAGDEESGASGDRESVHVLETQIDDMNPQFYGHVLDLLLDAGALDAFLTPVIMKKSRPGVLLTVLAPTAQAGRLTELIFRETTTIGLRSYPVTRSVLPRSEARAETPFGAIRIKVVRQGDATRYTPEYEDCRQAALKAGVPLAEVYAAVHQAVGRMDLDDLP